MAEESLIAGQRPRMNRNTKRTMEGRWGLSMADEGNRRIGHLEFWRHTSGGANGTGKSDKCPFSRKFGNYVWITKLSRKHKQTHVNVSVQRWRAKLSEDSDSLFLVISMVTRSTTTTRVRFVTTRCTARPHSRITWSLCTWRTCSNSRILEAGTKPLSRNTSGRT